MARTSSAAHAAPNVVAFPNATACKVNNYQFADQRRAALAARKESPLCARYLSPAAREADKLARELADTEANPALLIVSAILRTMDADQYACVAKQLTGRPGYKMGREALAVVKMSRLSVDEQRDLHRAFDQMLGGSSDGNR